MKKTPTPEVEFKAEAIPAGEPLENPATSMERILRILLSTGMGLEKVGFVLSAVADKLLPAAYASGRKILPYVKPEPLEIPTPADTE